MLNATVVAFLHCVRSFEEKVLSWQQSSQLNFMDIIYRIAGNFRWNKFRFERWKPLDLILYFVDTYVMRTHKEIDHTPLIRSKVRHGRGLNWRCIRNRDSTAASFTVGDG